MEPNTAAWPKAEAFAPTGFGPDPFEPSPAPNLGAPPVQDRFWQQLLRARVLIAAVLLGLQGYLYLQGPASVLPLAVSACYLVVALASLRWARPNPTASAWSAGWALTLWVDLAVFTALQALQPGSGVAYTPLFFFPVLLAAVLGPLLLALGAAASATLALLGLAWWHGLQQPGTVPAAYVQSALTGAGLLAVAALANQLAQRLLREQTAARQSQLLASLEASVNSLIVAGLKEGVVVLAPDGSVWHANHAARAMLGTAPSSASEGGWQGPGWLALQQWLAAHPPANQEVTGELVLPANGEGQRRLRLRLQAAHAGADTPPSPVVFLEDQRDLETRLQNEKLAAMGRMSAAVAHEIRNPLAAITQANALLEEDALPPGQAKLTGMIRHNAQRLARTVDDILNLVQASPVEAHAGNTPVLDTLVQQVVQDWVQQHPQGMRLGMLLQAGEHSVLFEPDHLRRVLVNLLDNADRHADRVDLAIRVRTQVLPVAGKPQLQLVVWSQGGPLDPRVQAHLFEPFVSSGSRSSGLGLYICRELCQRYHASLDYERLDDDGESGNAFRISLPPCHTP